MVLIFQRTKITCKSIKQLKQVVSKNEKTSHVRNNFTKILFIPRDKKRAPLRNSGANFCNTFDSRAQNKRREKASTKKLIKNMKNWLRVIYKTIILIVGIFS